MDYSKFVRGSEPFFYYRRYPTEATKKVFQAVNSGDATLLNELLGKMQGYEKVFTLKTKMEAYRLYQAYYTTRATPLIVAVKKGNLDCVKVLLKHKADIEGRAGDDDVENCYMYENCTPLFVAAVSGNLDVLSCLIENGADVNACSDDQSTPLMIAAKYGHLKAVNFLIKHGSNIDLRDKRGDQALHHAIREKDDSCDVLRCLIDNGADVNACTNKNATPLMIASVGNKINQVSCLIEHGANLDLQDNSGDTAFHYAVYRNAPKVVDKLLSVGASQLPNGHRLTPLLLASNVCCSSLVEELIKRPEYSKEEVINALELLGASHITRQPPGTFVDDNPALEAFQFIKRGMEERFSNPAHPILKQPMEPFEAYQSRKECQTLEELAWLEFDENAIIMEGLIIRERILGTDNVELIAPIREIAKYHSDNGINMDNDISVCIGLYIHAMKKARICNESAISDVDGLTSFLYDRVIGNNPLRKQQLPLLELLQQTVIEFKRQQAEGVVKIDSFVFKPFESRELFDSFQKLLQIIAKYDDGDETDSSLSELLDKLRLLNPTTSEGDTLLHEAVDRNPLHIPPCPSAVKMLLNAGFSANATNDNGDTPLHRAITFSPIDDIHLLVLQALFNGGAHYDFVNKDGKRPMDLAQTDEARMILLEGRTIELKCISARAVKKFGIPYLGVVPKTLEKYISMH